MRPARRRAARARGSAAWVTAAPIVPPPATCSWPPVIRRPRTSRYPQRCRRAPRRRRVPRPRRRHAAPGDAPAVQGTVRAHRDARAHRRRGHRAADPVLRRCLPPVRLRAGHRRRGLRAHRGSRSSGWSCRSSSGAEYTATEHQLVDARNHLRQSRACRWSRSATSSPRWRTSPSAMRAPTGRAARRVPRRVLEAAGDRRPVEREVRAAREPGVRHPRRAGRAGVHRDGAGGQPRHQPARSAGLDRPDHRGDRAAAAPRDPRRPARPAARRGRRAPRARRRRRRPGREPRHRDEREPHAPPDDPTHGPHPSTQAARRRGPVRHHVRQGHVGGPEPTGRARRLPRRDRTHLRGHAGSSTARRFAALDTFLAAPGPDVVPEPEHLERYERAVAEVAAVSASGRATRPTRLADALGVEVAYAFLAFAASRSFRPAPCVRAGRGSSPGCAEPPPPVEASPSDGPPWKGPTSSSRSPTCPRSPGPRCSRSACRPVRRRSRSPGSGRGGASAAPGAANHRPWCSSGGRSSTRPWTAAANESGGSNTVSR